MSKLKKLSFFYHEGPRELDHTKMSCQALRKHPVKLLLESLVSSECLLGFPPEVAYLRSHAKTDCSLAFNFQSLWHLGLVTALWPYLKISMTNETEKRRIKIMKIL